MNTKIELLRYNKYRSAVCTRLNITISQYNQFRRLGEKLHQMYEFDCNGVDALGKLWDDKRSNKEETAVVKSINKLIKSIAGTKGLDGFDVPFLHVYHQTDPRGCPLYLSVKRMTDVDYPQTGFSIY